MSAFELPEPVDDGLFIPNVGAPVANRSIN